jgi:hypothetical protein
MTVFCFADIGDISVVPTSGLIYNNIGASAFNLDDPSQQPIFFTSTISNNTESDIVNYKLEISMYWREQIVIESITVRPKQGSDWSVLEPHSIRVLTNRDIIVNNSNDFAAETDLDFDEIRNNVPEFDEIFRKTGLMPDGEYRWDVQFFDENNNPLSNLVSFSYIIETPIDIMLTTPGSPIGSEVYFALSNRPTFVWFSNLNNYSLTVYEVNNVVETPEDILVNNPIIEISNIEGNSLTFPNEYGSLEEGKIYAWRVQAETFAPAGFSTETKYSKFYLFKIMTDSEQVASQQQLVNFILQLNIPQAQALIDLINSGYNLDAINFQGGNVSAEDLVDILNQIQKGTLRVKSVRVK